MMSQDDIRFIDAEERFYQQKLDYTQIIMRQIDKVRLSASNGWTEGFWETKTFSSGGMSYDQRVYTPDTREAYINAVDTLYDILIPYFDETFDAEENSIMNEYNAEKERLTQQETNAVTEGNDKESIEHYLAPYYLDNSRRHRQRLFRALIKLLKRGGLIDSKGVREVV